MSSLLSWIEVWNFLKLKIRDVSLLVGGPLFGTKVGKNASVLAMSSIELRLHSGKKRTEIVWGEIFRHSLATPYARLLPNILK